MTFTILRLNDSEAALSLSTDHLTPGDPAIQDSIISASKDRSLIACGFICEEEHIFWALPSRVLKLAKLVWAGWNVYSISTDAKQVEVVLGRRHDQRRLILKQAFVSTFRDVVLGDEAIFERIRKHVRGEAQIDRNDPIRQGELEPAGLLAKLCFCDRDGEKVSGKDLYEKTKTNSDWYSAQLLNGLHSGVMTFPLRNSLLDGPMESNSEVCFSLAGTDVQLSGTDTSTFELSYIYRGSWGMRYRRVPLGYGQDGQIHIVGPVWVYPNLNGASLLGLLAEASHVLSCVLAHAHRQESTNRVTVARTRLANDARAASMLARPVSRQRQSGRRPKSGNQVGKTATTWEIP